MRPYSSLASAPKRTTTRRFGGWKIFATAVTTTAMIALESNYPAHPWLVYGPSPKNENKSSDGSETITTITATTATPIPTTKELFSEAIRSMCRGRFETKRYRRQGTTGWKKCHFVAICSGTSVPGQASRFTSILLCVTFRCLFHDRSKLYRSTSSRVTL